MPSAPTASNIKERLDFTSDRDERMLPALRLFFGGSALYVCSLINKEGFHLAPFGHGGAFYEDEWLHMDRAIDRLPALADDVLAWLRDLSGNEKRLICGTTPTEEAYRRDPSISYRGYRITSSVSRDGEHKMLTVRPTWV